MKTERTGFGSMQSTQTAAETSSIDLFEPEVIEVGVRERKNCIVRPGAISDTGPIHLTVQPEGEYYLDPSSLRVCGEFKIEKWDSTGGHWKPLAAVTDPNKISVAPINMFTKALFKDIEVWMQQQQVSLVATTAYPIKAYLETLLSYGLDAERTLLACDYWRKDKPGKQDSLSDNADAVEDRYNFIANSRTVKFSNTIHTELTTMNRYLLPGLTFDFRFTLNDPSVYLQTTAADVNKYRAHFIDFYLTFDRVLLNTNAHNSIEKKMNSGQKSIYLVNRGTVRTKQISQGEVYCRWQTLYSGTLPDDVTICMLDSTAFNGAPTKNLFNFQHFNAESICLKVNSVVLPAKPIEADFANKDARLAYRHLFDNIGINTSNSPCLLTYEDFCQGSTLIPFDLTPDKCSSFHGHEKQTGVIELDIRFKSALPTGITVLAICNFSDRIIISGPINQREVFVNPALQG